MTFNFNYLLQNLITEVLEVKHSTYELVWGHNSAYSREIPTAGGYSPNLLYIDQAGLGTFRFVLFSL